MAQPVRLYGSSGQRIADESVDRRPIPFRVGAGAHGVTGTGDHEPFLALAGACGDIAIQLPGGSTNAPSVPWMNSIGTVACASCATLEACRNL